MSHQHKVCEAEWKQRPVFQRNQRLTPDRLNRIQEYQSERLRQLMLGVAGVGIVYGFAIKTHQHKDSDHYGHCVCEHGKIYIGCGLAIDCFGRQLHWPGGWVSIADLGGCLPEREGAYTLYVHYAERHSDVDQHCGCDDNGVDWVEEGVVFTLRPGCEKVDNCCPPLGSHQHSSEHCIERQGYICERLGATDHHYIDPPECLENLCHMPPEPCATAPCGWLYSDSAGLSLACVLVKKTESERCDPPYQFAPVDPRVCEFRQYVYRNPLLFELIQGCDKNHAHVESLSFEDWVRTNSWERPVPWRHFSKRIKHYGLAIFFSKPILKRTLNPASVIVTAIVREQDSMFKDVLRLPYEKMHFLHEHGDYALGVHLEFDHLWIANQIDTDLSRFSFPFWIEVTVRGAHLRDQCGDMLDARPLDFSHSHDDYDKPGYIRPYAKDEVLTETTALSKAATVDDKKIKGEARYKEEKLAEEKRKEEERRKQEAEERRYAYHEPHGCTSDKVREQLVGHDFVVAFCVEPKSISNSKDDDKDEYENERDDLKFPGGKDKHPKKDETKK